MKWHKQFGNNSLDVLPGMFLEWNILQIDQFLSYKIAIFNRFRYQTLSAWERFINRRLLFLMKAHGHFLAHFLFCSTDCLLYNIMNPILVHCPPTSPVKPHDCQLTTGTHSSGLAYHQSLYCLTQVVPVQIMLPQHT